MAESKTYGYARVSTADQNAARQIDQLTPLVSGKTAAQKMRHLIVDHASGASMERAGWRHLRDDLLRSGDTLVITSLDRLGRNYRQIVEEWRSLRDAGITVRVLDMPMLSAGVGDEKLGEMLSEMVLQLLAWVADNERTHIRQRQREGIAAARARGQQLGRVATVPENWNEIYTAWKNGEMTAVAAWKQLGISKTKFYYLAKRQREHGHV